MIKQGLVLSTSVGGFIWLLYLASIKYNIGASVLLFILFIIGMGL